MRDDPWSVVREPPASLRGRDGRWIIPHLLLLAIDAVALWWLWPHQDRLLVWGSGVFGATAAGSALLERSRAARGEPGALRRYGICLWAVLALLVLFVGSGLAWLLGGLQPS